MKRVAVAVAVISNSDNECLISLRKNGQHLSGLWEFPGGKIEQGESVFQALKREIEEELGLAIVEAQPFMLVDHDYPDKKVSLNIWKVTEYMGTPQSKEGQAIQWQHPTQMSLENFPEANRKIISELVNLN